MRGSTATITDVYGNRLGGEVGALEETSCVNPGALYPLAPLVDNFGPVGQTISCSFCFCRKNQSGNQGTRGFFTVRSGLGI